MVNNRDPFLPEDLGAIPKQLALQETGAQFVPQCNLNKCLEAFLTSEFFENPAKRTFDLIYLKTKDVSCKSEGNILVVENEG